MSTSSPIPGLRTVLNWLQSERHRNEDRNDAAVNALYVATTETQIYLETTRTDGPTRASEEQLGRLWGNAALALRKVDPELAKRCFSKANAWVQPDRWTDEEISDAGIGIDEMHKELRHLLLGE